jgi:cell division protease FtsH
MTGKTKLALACAALVAAAGIVFNANSGRALPTLTYSQFLDEVRSGQVASTVITAGASGATQATCRLKDGRTARTVLPAHYNDVLATMLQQRVNVEIRDGSLEPLRLFLNAAPFLILLAVWLILFRKFRNGSLRGALR